MNTARDFLTLLNTTLKESNDGSEASFTAKLEEVKSANTASILESPSTEDLTELVTGISNFRESLLDDLKENMERMAREFKNQEYRKKTAFLAELTKAIQQKLIELDRLAKQKISQPKPVPIVTEKKAASPAPAPIPTEADMKSQQKITELTADVDKHITDLTAIKAKVRQRILDEISQAVYDKMKAPSDKPKETGAIEQEIALIAKAVESQQLVDITINAITQGTGLDPDIKFKFQRIGMQDEKGAATIAFTPAELYEEVLEKKRSILLLDSSIFQIASKTLLETERKLAKKPDRDQVTYLQTIVSKLDKAAADINFRKEADPKLKSQTKQQVAKPKPIEEKQVAKNTIRSLFSRKTKATISQPAAAAANRHKH